MLNNLAMFILVKLTLLIVSLLPDRYKIMLEFFRIASDIMLSGMNIQMNP